MRNLALCLVAQALLMAGCRTLERHTSEKPKIKNRMTTGLEAGTNLYAEGFGPNRYDPKRPASPYESVNLKWKVEYGVEW